jgi:hypothetical protein
MKRVILRAAVAGLLVGAGWLTARAQTPTPDFEFVIDAPAGQTSVRCVRGCSIMWVERGVNPNGRPQETFEFACTGSHVGPRCSSARVGGWLTR